MGGGLTSLKTNEFPSYKEITDYITSRGFSSVDVSSLDKYKSIGDGIGCFVSKADVDAVTYSTSSERILYIGLPNYSNGIAYYFDSDSNNPRYDTIHNQESLYDYMLSSVHNDEVFCYDLHVPLTVNKVYFHPIGAIENSNFHCWDFEEMNMTDWSGYEKSINLKTNEDEHLCSHSFEIRLLDSNGKNWGYELVDLQTTDVVSNGTYEGMNPNGFNNVNYFPMGNAAFLSHPKNPGYLYRIRLVDVGGSKTVDWKVKNGYGVHIAGSASGDAELNGTTWVDIYLNEGEYNSSLGYFPIWITTHGSTTVPMNKYKIKFAGDSSVWGGYVNGETCPKNMEIEVAYEDFDYFAIPASPNICVSPYDWTTYDGNKLIANGVKTITISRTTERVPHTVYITILAEASQDISKDDIFICDPWSGIEIPYSGEEAIEDGDDEDWCDRTIWFDFTHTDST